MQLRLATIPAAALILIGIVACGGGGSNDPSGTQTSDAELPTATDGAPPDASGPAKGVVVFATPANTRAAIEALLGRDALPVFLAGRSRDAATFDGLTIPGDREVVGTTLVSTARADSGFDDRYVSAYGAEPTDAARQAYDAVYLGVLSAIAANSTDLGPALTNLDWVASAPGDIIRAGPEDLEAVATLFENGVDVDLQGASGLLDLTAEGGVSRGAVEVWKLINGSAAPLETRDVDLVAEVGAEVPNGALTSGRPPVPPLVIGIIGAEGDGTGAVEAALLAIEEINAAGGAFGVDVMLAVEDPSADAAAATQAVLDAGATVVVGSPNADIDATAAGVAAEAVAPFLSLSGAASLVGVHETVKNIAPPETLQTAAIANLALEREADVVCVLYEDTPYGNAMAAAFRIAIEHKNGAVRFQEGFSKADVGALLDECLG